MESYAEIHADIPDKNSCGVCLSSGTCRYHSAAQNKPMSVYSTKGEVLGKQKQQVHSEGHEMGTILKPVDEKQGGYERQEKRETQGLKQDISQERAGHSSEHSFLGSSVCYGGPDEYYESVKQRKDEINKIKMNVKKLEEAADPSNLKYTTRGNWWKGSLDY